MTTSDCVQVQTTTGSREEAERVAVGLLGPRLAACVQVVGPIESRYWWNGALETATEWLCLAKTTAERVSDATAAINEAHSYDTPEVLVTPVTGGDERYLQWIRETVILGR